MRIVDTDEMREIETKSFENYFLAPGQIIENVGVRGSDFISKHILKEEKETSVLILCGKGNNGADGLAIGRHLVCRGHSVVTFLLYPPEECSSEMNAQIRLAHGFGIEVVDLKEVGALEDYCGQVESYLFIDAIFGMGVRLPLGNSIYHIIQFLNAYSPNTISIDIPSGVDSTTGETQGNAVIAQTTLAVGLLKTGLYVGDGPKHSGQIQILNVGLPPQLLTGGDKRLLALEDIIETVGRRNKFADKKVYGHSLVIGGSHGLTGALCLTTEAALRVGAGLVTGATWEAQYHEFLSRLAPEVMTGYIPSDDGKWKKLVGNLSRYSSIVVGPGLGRSARARRAVLEVLKEYNGPVILDADAINVLKISEDRKLFQARKAPTVLTPHVGELARFLDLSVDDIQSDPLGHLKSLIEKIPCSAILKGPCTFLAIPSGKFFFSFYPNDGMASGGSGDVLAGILGGLLCQGPLKGELDKILGLAILIHTQAGKIAAEKLGVRAMTAGSLIDSLPETFQEIDRFLKQAEGRDQ